MPDLNFTVTGVEPAARGIVPLLLFNLEVTNAPADELIQSATLQVQIQFECPKRAYDAEEKEKLLDLFGEPERWGQTLRNRLWTHAVATVGSFSGTSTACLSVPCTFDLNVSAAKYFYALDEGDVPLLFLFSGTVFYSTQDGRLQVQRISHEKECSWRMPARLWRDLMDHHWPNTAWITLHRDVFDRLCEFKRRNGLPTWEQTLERLLDAVEAPTPTEAAMLDILR
jgi:hypothetical protein